LKTLVPSGMFTNCSQLNGGQFTMSFIAIWQGKGVHH
jgi:hypothetical protein